MTLSWPLVGREEELEFVTRALGTGGGVILAGEAGVGKTRLAREALALAEGRGTVTAWAVATETARSIPFGAFAHLLPDAPGPAFTRQEVIRAAAATLVPRGGDSSFILGVDDAHLLDDHAAALLHHLAIGRRALVIASIRSGMTAPDAVTSLWKDNLCERLDVQALSQEEARRLLEAALQGQVDEATVLRLWQQTRGNPLFLRELVHGGLEAGRLTLDDGVWRWKGTLGPFPRLEDVIASRIGAMPPDQRNVAELVAVGEPIEVRALETIAARDAIEDLERSGILTESTEGQRRSIRLSHPLHSESLRAAMPRSRLRTIAEQLADVVLGSGARRKEDLLRVAAFSVEAGRKDRRDLIAAATRRALALYDYPLAERLASSILDGEAGIEPALSLAEALIGQGRFEDADALFAHTTGATEEQRTRLVLARATNRFWHLKSGLAADELVRAAEDETTDPGLRAALVAARGEFLLYGGRTAEGIALALPLLDSFPAEAPPAVQAATVAAFGRAMEGRTLDAVDIVERFLPGAVAIAEMAPLAPDWLRGISYLASAFEGRLDDAMNNWRLAYQSLLDRPGAGPPRAIWGFFIGWGSRLQGKVVTASRALRESLPILREGDLLTHLPACLAELAHCAALVGDTAAPEILHESRARRAPSFKVDEAHVLLAEVWIDATGGQTSRAARKAIEAADVLHDLGQRAYEAMALHDAARLGAAPDVGTRLAALASGSAGDLFDAFAEHADALAASDGARLDAVALRFEKMGMMLFAAEAAAAASGAHRTAGKTGSALAAAALASSFQELCEGARTPALHGEIFALPLTRREREIALLAVRGLSTKEIADRLVVSARTIDNHLHNIYGKLGISGRDELGSIIEPLSSDRIDR